MLRLIAISWPTFFDGEAETINALFESGLSLLHVRKPDARQDEVERLIRRINPEFHDRIAMHYFPELAEKYELGGYHISAGRPGAPEDWDGRVSVSCHSLDEAREHLRDADYVFLSPIFDSISKSGYQSNFTPEQLASAELAGYGKKVFALGGVTPERMHEVQDYGFGGVAVLGGLWKSLRRDDIMKSYWNYLNWEKVTEDSLALC